MKDKFEQLNFSFLWSLEERLSGQGVTPFASELGNNFDSNLEIKFSFP